MGLIAHLLRYGGCSTRLHMKFLSGLTYFFLKRCARKGGENGVTLQWEINAA
jgi:hypothetical protein